MKPASHYFHKFDSYVLLTEYMREVVPTRDDNYIVNEGVYEEFVTKRPPHQEDPTCFTIFYGGMLYEKFGIMNLVNAVHLLDDPDIRLLLCGYGDCADRVRKLSKIDKRIQYLGVVCRDKVLDLQSKASLLVTPRVADGNPFTRYSFPSKTMEYFASGTPTLLYQLEGIPQEYYSYCYSLDAAHTSPQDLADKIKEIKATPAEARLQKAASARKFVLDEKKPTKVAIQILTLLKRTI